MFETARYEIGRRLRETAFLSVAVSLYAAFIVWYYTVLEGVAIEEVFEELPPAMMEAFGIETLSTIEGFLGAQIYNFVWILGLGLYFAYVAGGSIATDIESDRMEILLSFPITRSQLLVERLASLLLPIVVVNVVVGCVVYLLAAAIGEQMNVTHLAATHALSIPYLFVCTAIGLVFSVAADRAAIAERGAVGVVFVLFLVESIVGGASEYEWIQYVSPTQYYDPTPLLIDGSYELIDTGILLVTFAGLVLLSQILFYRRDV
ncbi:ABC transporter permease subunit [Halorubrum cibi]|uniref:ABC-2 type transport system permease protein n=1 Tax=Halorubrum cibi TaxID=413815 RepID=A0A521ALT5_9EURY|nr:ABC transporter permease subunit [Halorubrum cibi]SMO35752.1 ABC-2 type transport system permease protein [Halorubrum cibi]